MKKKLSGECLVFIIIPDSNISYHAKVGKIKYEEVCENIFY